MSTYVKSYMFFQLKKKGLFDLNIFPEISSFYGDGLIPKIEENFETAFAWMWYDPKIHIITYYGNIYDHARSLWSNNRPIIDMGDGFMSMDEYAFRNFLDLEIDYEYYESYYYEGEEIEEETLEEYL